jgi:hypothetical protein
MNRQLQADGGIMQVTPRENFGLGSKLKKFARKIIPNEVADIAVKAAPFVAPFNPALAGAMAGIGTFDQTGSIGDSLKSGALTYGGGQAARYIGGAGFQGNPFASGGAFTPSGFTSGFSKPIGTDTGLGKFFSNRGTQPVSSVGDGLTGSEVGGEITLAESAGGTSASPNILAEQMSEVSLTPQNIAEKVTQETLTGSPNQMSITESIKQIVSPNSTMGDRGNAALDLLKRTGKAAFTKEGKNGPVPDKAAILGALAFTASYAEAKALAAETGIDTDLTEAEYDELKKAEKQEEYAGYLTNFFAGKKDGGRIGFKDGTPDEIMEQFYESNDPDANKSTYTMEDFDIIREPEVVLVENYGPEGIKLEKMLKSDAIKYGLNIVADSIPPGLEGEVIDLSVFGKKDGGRIGFSQGADLEQKLKDLADYYMERGLSESDAYETAAKELYKADGGRIGLKFGSKPEEAEIGIMSIDVEAGDDEDEENDLMAGITFSSAEKSYLFRRLGGAGGASRSYTMPQLYRILSNPNRYATDAAILKEIAIMGMKADGGRIGFAGGSNRVSELLVLRDSMLAKDADADVSDIEAELFQLTGKTFRSVGGIGDVPTGKLTQNKAGVIERDYRDEGGFVPVGIKERADDVPAMLSKNEFVMTADAVRGIGGGDVEEGSKKLYKTMKQAEQVGKA